MIVSVWFGVIVLVLYCECWTGDVFVVGDMLMMVPEVVVGDYYTVCPVILQSTGSVHSLRITCVFQVQDYGSLKQLCLCLATT